MESIQKQLLDKGLRPTYIRIRIYGYMRSSREHPTAEMVFEHLFREIPTLSKTSVYNNLNIFVEKGLIKNLGSDGIQSRFDGSVMPHLHFICDNCRKIIDIEYNSRIIRKKELAGHLISGYCGYFRGICSKCRLEEKE
jgi:Fur family peroxide stress response transcriptional regulator